MDVARLVLNRQQQHHVEQLADRGRIGERFGVADVELLRFQRRDRRLQLFVVRQFGDQLLDALRFAVVVLLDRLQHFPLGRDDHLDLVAQERPQLVLDRQVLWVARRQRQHVVLEPDRHHPVQLGHRLGNLLEHFRVEFRVFERNRLHPHLLGERLHQLLVGDQLHVLGDFAEQSAGLLFLLLQHRLQLVVGEEAEVNENLSDATRSHDESLNI